MYKKYVCQLLKVFFGTKSLKILIDLLIFQAIFNDRLNSFFFWNTKIVESIEYSSVGIIISHFIDYRIIKTDIFHSNIFVLKTDNNIGPIVFFWKELPVASLYFIYMLPKRYENYLYIISISSKILELIKH